MKRFWCSLWIGIGLLTLAGCSHVSRQQEVFHQVASHQLSPDRSFISNGKLYLRYQIGEKFFVFVGDLGHVKGEKNEKTLLLSVQEDVSPKKKHPVHLVQHGFNELVKYTLLPLVPPQPGQGILVFLDTYETLLYRQTDGKPGFVLLKDAPSNVDIVGEISQAQFTELYYQELRKIQQASGTKQTRFLLKLDNVPLSPFLYVDTKTGENIRLELPEYYQIKKEMSRLGFSTSIIYSFLIKSHLWSAVKAPFTTTHRLALVGTSTVYAMIPVRFGDLETVPPLNSQSPMDLSTFNEWLDKHISKQVYKARVKLLIDGEEFFPHWMLEMQRAQESIFTTVYIFMSDPYGLSIADVMKKRASQGVDVRVVVDELNNVLNSGKNPELMPSEKFVMPKYITSYLRKKSSVKARTHLNPWSTFDHTKVYIIDRKLAYVGGMNIGEEYRYTWHDMMVALEGPIVGRLVKNFYKNWSFVGAGGDFAAGYRQLFSKRKRQVNQEAPDMIPVRLMYTKPHDSQIFQAQLEAIKRARQRIYIQNAYFADDRIVRELIAARGRGVDVRVILPGTNDVAIMDKSNRYIANQLFNNGIRVYFYKGMTHVKAAVYDGWAVVGSANFDKMSLHVNREMSLGIEDPSFVAELVERLFEKDFENSQEMTRPLELSWTYAVITSVAGQL